MFPRDAGSKSMMRLPEREQSQATMPDPLEMAKEGCHPGWLAGGVAGGRQVTQADCCHP